MSKTPVAEERNYSNELKKELEITNEENKTFTKEEIYSFSRMESIINEKNQEGEGKEGKVKDGRSLGL